MTTKVTVERGKYTFEIEDSGQVTCQRWDDANNRATLTRCGQALIALIHELHDRQEHARKLSPLYREISEMVSAYPGDGR